MNRQTPFVTFTSPFNITGQPAISLPYWTTAGLPIGVQVVAAYGREDWICLLAACVAGISVLTRLRNATIGESRIRLTSLLAALNAGNRSRRFRRGKRIGLLGTRRGRFGLLLIASGIAANASDSSKTIGAGLMCLLLARRYLQISGKTILTSDRPRSCSIFARSAMNHRTTQHSYPDSKGFPNCSIRRLN